MANAETARLIAVLELKDLFSDKISKAEKSLGKLESRSTKAGRQIGVGILRGAAVAAGAVTTLGAVFAKGISAASDLSETTSKVGVVFGKNAKEILDFGKTSAAALGLSENAALSAAATYGNLFVSMGLSSDKSADMSKKLVTLAGDLASFNNIDPTEALEKLRAGLTGESEPLKSLGININETIIKAKALELGLVKTSVSTADLKLKSHDLAAATNDVAAATKKYGAGSVQALEATVKQEKAQAALTNATKKIPAVLDPATKAQAAYALILEQSGTAQGDFGRTSGGMANQIRILKANFTDMLATLAAPALPGVAKIFQNLNKEIKANQPAIAALGEKIGGLFTDDNIKSGFNAIKQGFQIAKDAAPAIADAARITGAALKIAVDAFKSLPKEVQQIAIAGLAVNKLTGGLVTNIAGGIIDTVGKSFLQRGGTPANPLFVSDVTGGLGGVPGAAGGGLAGLLKGGLKFVLPIAAGVLIANAIREIAGITPEQSAENQRHGQFGPRSQSNVQSTPFDSPLGRAPIAGDRTLDSPLGKMTVGAVRSMSTAFRLSVTEFRKATAALKGAKTGKEVAAAIKASLGLIFTKGLGGSGGAENTLKALRAQLKNTHDPALQRTLTAAISKVEHKLAARKVVEDQLKKADQIFRSSKTNAQKIKELEHVEKVIGNRNSIATKRVQDKIDQAKRAQVAEQKRTTDAVHRKKLAVTNNITIPVANTVSVDARAVVRTNTTFHKYFSTATTRVQE